MNRGYNIKAIFDYFSKRERYRYIEINVIHISSICGVPSHQVRPNIRHMVLYGYLLKDNKKRIKINDQLSDEKFNEVLFEKIK